MANHQRFKSISSGTGKQKVDFQVRGLHKLLLPYPRTALGPRSFISLLRVIWVPFPRPPPLVTTTLPSSQNLPHFPTETKELKKRIRNIIDPTRDLGHVDGHKASTSTETTNLPSNNALSPSASSVENQSATSIPTGEVMTDTPIPLAINRLHRSKLSADGQGGGERRLTPVCLLSYYFLPHPVALWLYIWEIR